jgi:hypothetical protein
MVQPNVFERAGISGIRLLMDGIQGHKSHQQITDELVSLGFETTRSNVTQHINNMRNNFKPQIALHHVSTDKYTAELELEKIFHKVKEIEDSNGTKYEVDPLQVLHHNVIRIDKYIMSGHWSIETQVDLMLKQSAIAERLAKLQPPDLDPGIDVNALYEQADQIMHYISLPKTEEIFPGIQEDFAEYVRSLKEAQQN